MAASGGQWRPWLRGSAIALLLLALVALGFVGYLYGLSDVQEARSQAILYQQFQLELANQVAPLGPYGPNGLNGTRGPTPPIGTCSGGVKAQGPKYVPASGAR